MVAGCVIRTILSDSIVKLPSTLSAFIAAMPRIHNFQKADPQVYRRVVLRMVLLRCVKSSAVSNTDAHIHTVPSINSAISAFCYTQMCNFSIYISDKYFDVQNIVHLNHEP